MGVGVVHRHRLLVGGERVGERRAGFDEGLGERSDAVVGVVDVDAVPVDVGGDGQVVLDPHLHLVPDVEVHHRGRDHAVEGPRLDHLAGRDLPVRELHREVEHLGAVGLHLGGLEELVPGAFGLGRERRKRVEHVGGHLVVVHLTVGGVLALRRGRRGGAASFGDRERRRHAGVGVAADLAQQLVAPRLQRREVELARLPGGQVGGLQIGVDHPQVVGGRTVVGHVQRPTAGHVDGARCDGELGEGHVHVAGLGAAGVVVSGDERSDRHHDPQRKDGDGPEDQRQGRHVA